MTSFPIPTRAELSETNQAQFDALQKGLGFVPNLYAAIAWSDHGLARYLAYQGAKTSLSNREKEAVNLAVSEVNGCRYCLSAHTVLAKMNGFSEADTLDLRRGHATDARLATLAALARNVAETKGRATPAVVEAFFAAGYTRGHLVDVILQVSDKTAMNYLHNLTEIPIDFPLAADLATA